MSVVVDSLRTTTKCTSQPQACLPAPLSQTVNCLLLERAALGCVRPLAMAEEEEEAKQSKPTIKAELALFSPG